MINSKETYRNVGSELDSQMPSATLGQRFHPIFGVLTVVEFKLRESKVLSDFCKTCKPKKKRPARQKK